MHYLRTAKSSVLQKSGVGFRKIEGMTVRKHPFVIIVLRYRLGIGSKNESSNDIYLLGPRKASYSHSHLCSAFPGAFIDLICHWACL